MHPHRDFVCVGYHLHDKLKEDFACIREMWFVDCSCYKLPHNEHDYGCEFQQTACFVLHTLKALHLRLRVVISHQYS